MLKVLIAIKSEPLSKRLSSSLAQYDLAICRTGSEALVQMECLHPDILLLDLMLPDIDGITVLQKADYKPRIVLAFTNLATECILTRAARAGIQDVFLIPCSVHYVTAHLEKLIGNALFAER